MLLKLPSQLQVSISSVSPFVVGSDTEIEVCFTYEDHTVVQDLGYFLMAPDGVTVIPLKDADDPTGFCNFFGGAGSSVNLCFTTELAAGDTLDICGSGPAGDISGNYAATGDWSNFYGMNPADGGWAIVIADYLSTEGTGNPDGFLTNATISFTDTSIFTGELTTIQFESGAASIPILEGDGITPGGLTYLVPQGLRTSCYGSCDAIAKVSVTGGTPPYVIYDWDDPLVPDLDSVTLCAGSYNVTVTDAMGCTGSTSVEVISPPEIIINETSHTDTLQCSGDSNGTITVKASGGTGNLTYTLLPSTPSEAADSGYWTGLPADTYTIRVEDAKGCYTDTTITIHEKEPLLLTATITDNVLCEGDVNGRIEAVATGGKAPYTYTLLSTVGPPVSQPSGVFTGLGEGKYVVRVDDDNGCGPVETDTLKLGLDFYLTIDTVLVEPIACTGDTGRIGVVVGGGTPPYSVSITGGPNPAAFPYYTQLTIQPDSAMGIDAHIETGRGNDDVNYGKRIDLQSCAYTDGGVPYTARSLIAFDLDTIPAGRQIGLSYLSLYSYDSPQDGHHETISGSNEALLQRVTSPWDESTVTWNTQPNVTTTNEVLLPASTANIQHYENIDITAFIQEMYNNPATNYGMLFRLVTEDYYRKMLFASSDNADSTLWPKLDVYYRYPGMWDTLYFDLTAGSYDIVVYDAAGCSVNWTETINLTDPPALIIDSVHIDSVTTCYDDPSGSIEIFASGGTGDLEYAVTGQPFTTDSLFTGLLGGNYTITVRDENLCETSFDTSIYRPAELVVVPSVVPVEGNILGSITLNASGGTPYPPPDEYRYSIDGGPLTTDNVFEDLDVGNYLCHVEDANGCVWENYVTVWENNMIVTFYIQNADCYGEPTGRIDIDIDNGSEPYTITLCDTFLVCEDPITNVLDNQLPFPIASVRPDAYRILITDDSGREIDTTIYVTSPPELLIPKDSTHITCHEYTMEGLEGSDGSITYNVSGGTPGYTYEWADNTALNQPSRTNLTKGVYPIRITDANDCFKLDTTILVGLDTLAAGIELSLEDPLRDMTNQELQRYPSSADDTLCYLSNWILGANWNTNIGSVNIDWSPAFGLDYLGDTALPDPTFTMVEPISFRLEIDNGRCMDYDIINLGMYDTLNMNITFSTDLVTVGDTIISPAGSQIALNSTDGFIEYLWMAIPEANGTYEDEMLQNSVLIPADSLIALVRGTSPDRCYEFDSVYLVIRQPIGEYFDVFTPNDDGYNDTWIIPNADQYPDLEVFIYNRWGQQVFYSKPYGTDPSHTWDGRSQKNNKELPIGSYYFIIKPNDGEQETITGTVTIVR
jgi:gliding motility-associated-like protein